MKNALMATRILAYVLAVMALAVWFLEPFGALVRTASLTLIVIVWIGIFQIVRQISIRRVSAQRGLPARRPRGVGFTPPRSVGAPPSSAAARAAARTERASAHRSRELFTEAIEACSALVNMGFKESAAREAVQLAADAGANDFDSLFRAARQRLA